ncbi:MAG: hypothetical protein HYS06_04085 [Methylocystis sp.]|nr:hypothetical protein [Methylocystis sp.]
MWRNLLDGETTRARDARRDLLKLARLANLEEDTLAAIDEAIFDELFRVILNRCRASRDDTRLNGMALLIAASALGEIRQAA